MWDGMSETTGQTTTDREPIWIEDYDKNVALADALNEYYLRSDCAHDDSKKECTHLCQTLNNQIGHT